MFNVEQNLRFWLGDLGVGGGGGWGWCDGRVGVVEVMGLCFATRDRTHSVRERRIVVIVVELGGEGGERWLLCWCAAGCSGGGLEGGKGGRGRKKGLARAVGGHTNQKSKNLGKIVGASRGVAEMGCSPTKRPYAK